MQENVGAAREADKTNLIDDNPHEIAAWFEVEPRDLLVARLLFRVPSDPVRLG